MPTIQDDDLDALNDERNPARQSAPGHHPELDNDIAGLENMYNNGPEGRSGDLSGGPKTNLERGDKSNPGKGDTGGIASKQAEAPKDEKSQGRLGKLRSQYNGLRGKAGKLLSSKWAIGIGGVGGLGIALFVILIVVFMSAFKVPHLMENITEYQSARIVQQMTRQNDRTFRSYVSAKAADTETYKKLKDKYDSKAAATQEYWDKLTGKWNPNAQIRTLNNQGVQLIQTSDGHITGIEIAGKQTFKPKPSFGNKLIPGYKFANEVQYARTVGPQLNLAVEGNNPAVITRGLVGLKYAKGLGISYRAWTLAKVLGETPKEAAEQAYTDSVEAAKLTGGDGTTATPAEGKSDDLNKAQDSVEQAEAEELKKPAAIDEAITKNGGMLPGVKSAISAVGNDSAYKAGLRVANPVYAIAAPICIIYDGSVSGAGSTIDNNRTSASKDYAHMASVSDEIKDGNESDNTIVRAYSDKIGPLTGSAPIATASGQTPNTKGVAAVDAGPSGEFTAFNVVFGGADSNKAKIANFVADHTCDKLTNLYVAGGIAVANIIQLAAVTIGTLGVGDGVEAGVEGALESTGQIATKQIADKAVERFSTAYFKEKAVSGIRFTRNQILFAGATASATILARAIVAERAGQLTPNGSEWGDGAAESLDAGGNVYYNDLMREQYYGAPMGKTAVAASQASDIAYIKQQQSHKSFSTRYLALSNPHSLLSNVGVMTYNTFDKNPLGNVLKSVKTIFSPSFISKHVATLLNPAVMATDTPTAATYGNIQFGWTAQEQAYMDNHDDFASLENERILEASGLSDKINDTYGKCFTDSVGTLVQNEEVLRDDDGNVLNDTDGDATNQHGLCSPNNLGPNNPDNEFSDSLPGHANDMVLRWRVAQSDNTDLDVKIDAQTVSDDSTNTGGAGSQFRISSFNICYGVATAGGSGGLATCAAGQDYKTRLARSVKYITDNNLEVVGLQEVRGPNTPSGDQFDAIQAALPNYGIYPTDYKEGYAGQDPIIWDKSKFTMIPEGTKLIPGYTVTAGPDSKANTQVELKDNTTGQEFYVINEHEPVHNDHQTQIWRRDSAKERADYVTQLASQGLPIFVTGDMNSSYSATKGIQTALNGSRDNLPYCILTDNTGLWDSLDASKNQTGHCPLDQDSGVDHVYMTTSVTATNYTYNFGGVNNNGSDHKTLFVDVTIPGGGATATTGGTSQISYQNPVYADAETPDPSVIRDDDGTYHVYATGLQHLTSKDLVHWTKSSTPFLTGAPSSSTAKMWGPNVVKSTSGYILSWGGSSGGSGFSIYYATGSSAAGPFKYRGTIINSVSPYNLDPSIYMSDRGPILYYGSGTQGITAAKLTIGSDGSVRAADGGKILFPVDPISEWIAEGAWMQKHGSYYYLYYSVGRYDFSSGYASKPHYQVHVARSTSPLGPFEKDPAIVLRGDDSSVSRPGGESITTDNAGNEWMVYHAYVGSNHSERKLMIDPITYSSNGWPTVRNGIASATQQADGPANGAGSTATTGTTNGSGNLTKSFVGNDGFGGGFCTDYVKYILSRHSTKYKSGSLGNGEDVANNLGKLGYTVDHKPAVHAVVSFPGPPYGLVRGIYYGHVAFVAQLNGDGSIEVEEANYNNSMAYGTHHVSADEAATLTYAHTEVGWH